MKTIFHLLTYARRTIKERNSGLEVSHRSIIDFLDGTTGGRLGLLPRAILQDRAGCMMKSESKSEAELGHVVKLYRDGKISDDQFRKMVIRITGEMEQTKRLKNTLREIDSRYRKKSSPVVQGGLPSLGKKQ